MKQNSNNRNLGRCRRPPAPGVSRPSVARCASSLVRRSLWLSVSRPSRLGQLGLACPRSPTSQSRALQAAALQPLEGRKKLNFEK